MFNEYDARNPRKGVRVDGAPIKRAQGLSHAQYQMAYGPTRDVNGKIRPAVAVAGVLRDQRLGGPVGLGVMSAARDIQNAVRRGDAANVPDKFNVPVATRGHGVRPAYKRRSPKMGPKNPVFCKPLRSHRVDEQLMGKRIGKQLRVMYRRITSGKPKVWLEERYEGLRRSYLLRFGQQAVRLLNDIERVGV